MHIECGSIASVWSPVIESIDSITRLEVVATLGPEAYSPEPYRALRRRVFAAFVDENPWGMVPWEIMVEGQEDTPYTRARGFWARRSEDLQVSEGALEAEQASDGTIMRAGAHPLIDAARFLDRLERKSYKRRPRGVGFVLPTMAGTAQVEQVLEVALRLPRGGDYQAHFMMVGAAVASGSGILMQSETERHVPSLCFYGDAGVIEKIDATLRSMTPETEASH